MRISHRTTLGITAFVLSALSVAASSAAETSLKSAEDGGPRRWSVMDNDLQLHAAPTANAEAIARLSKGDLLSNLGGCKTSGAETWCHVRPLSGGSEGHVRADRLHPATGPDGLVPTGIDDSKQRARKRDYDGKGDIPCAQEQGQSLGTCAAATARSGGGDATVVVTFPNGFARQLYFTHGAFVRASATMSGVGTDMDWQLQDGVYAIRVDDQRFEVPSGMVLGN